VGAAGLAVLVLYLSVFVLTGLDRGSRQRLFARVWAARRAGLSTLLAVSEVPAPQGLGSGADDDTDTGTGTTPPRPGHGNVLPENADQHLRMVCSGTGLRP
jgi:hypothetical protein